MKERLFSMDEVNILCNTFLIIDQFGKHHIGNNLENLITTVESYCGRAIEDIYAGIWSVRPAIPWSAIMEGSNIKKEDLITVPDFIIKFKGTANKCNVEDITWIRLYC